MIDQLRIASTKLNEFAMTLVYPISLLKSERNSTVSYFENMVFLWL